MDKGAHFHACDFQVHTPRDANWHGSRATTDDERKAYAAELVQACREKGLDAIAITDHHDFAFFPFVRQAAANEVDPTGNRFPRANPRGCSGHSLDLTRTHASRLWKCPNSLGRVRDRRPFVSSYS